MSKLIITALTEKGRAVLSKKEKQSYAGRKANKLFGIREEWISKDPFIIWVSLGRFSHSVDIVTSMLMLKFERSGAKNNIDYKIEVEE